MQAVANLTASLATRGIGVVTSGGAPRHIDFLNKTVSTGSLEELTVAASKSYLDWYMLTQARMAP